MTSTQSLPVDKIAEIRARHSSMQAYVDQGGTYVLTIGDAAEEAHADRATLLALLTPEAAGKQDAEPEESGWLIEHENSPVSAPVYWSGLTWQTDHLKAVRFARKQDAEEVTVLIYGLEDDGHQHRICEHSWSGPRAAPAPEKPHEDTAHHANGLDGVTGGTGVGFQSLPHVVPTSKAPAVSEEQLARCLYEADHKGMANIWDWDDSGLDDEHPGARERYYRQADAILKLIGRSGEAAVTWQPIETAPKDGTQVDLWICYSERHKQFMRLPQCVWRGGKWYSNFARMGQTFPIEGRATHWASILKHPPAES